MSPSVRLTASRSVSGGACPETDMREVTTSEEAYRESAVEAGAASVVREGCTERWVRFLKELSKENWN